MSEDFVGGWTYSPSKQEYVYLKDALGPFFEDQWLVDVLYKVRVGKEASCYCCRANPATGHDLVAAKVYRPRQFRAMRNDWYYRLGRTMETPDHSLAYRGRVLRALKKHTNFGKRVETLSWTNHELRLLEKLHAEEIDVPKPLAGAESAMLMEYIGDESQGAPTLHMVSLDESEAQPLFDRVIQNVEGMLRLYMVHSDLSAHNILYWNGEIRVIDFPQAVVADQHPGAFELLVRDVTRVCEYFGKQGVKSDPISIVTSMWGRMQEGRL